MSLFSFFQPRRPATRPRRLPRHLWVEALEDRSLPSTLPLSGVPDLERAGLLNAADFKNPPSPIGTTSSTAANVNTDVEVGFHNETTIAVNPTNPLNMIGSANDFQGGFNPGGQLYFTLYPRARVTFDGGRTWTTYPIPFHGYSHCADPALSFDADGTAYLTTLGRVHTPNLHTPPNSGETADDLLVSRSTDGGLSWSTPVRVAVGKGALGPHVQETSNDKPYVTAWGHGNALVTWTQLHWGPQGVFIDAPVMVSVTHDGGARWTAPVQVSGSVLTTTGAVPTVAADGSLYVAYMSYYQSAGLGSQDHYEVVQVDPATGQALAAPVEVGLIHDGADDYPISFEGRQTYQDSQFKTFSGGNLAADPTNAGHLAVVWTDMRNNPYPDGLLPSHDPYQVRTNSDVIISQSFNGGLTWSPPTALAMPNDQFMAWGAYDATGRLQIGFYDRSYDPANHCYGYSLAGETAPGTLGFTTQQVTTALSDPTHGDAFAGVTLNSNFPNATHFIGDYSTIAVTPHGVATLWTDMRLPTNVPGTSGAGEDVFFALVPTPSPLAAAGRVAGTSRLGSLTATAAEPLLAEALHHWQAVGIDISALGVIDVRIANLGGATLGQASGHTIWLDDNAASWGWFVDKTPWDDAEFIRKGNQGEQGRMDLLTVLTHEVGHLLGKEHEAGGVMQETLAPGTRLAPHGGPGWLGVLDPFSAADLFAALKRRRHPR
jgi:hypothetical protein